MQELPQNIYGFGHHRHQDRERSFYVNFRVTVTVNYGTVGTYTWDRSIGAGSSTDRTVEVGGVSP
jgi:hypothetical protein